MSAASEQRILVLGGGFGGAQAALAAREALGDGHQVTVVDRVPISHLCGANPLLVVGERPAEGVSRSLETLAERGIELIGDEVTRIDLETRRVETVGGNLRYDHLVVALGAEYDWEAVPGSGLAHSFYDHQRSVRLREALEGFEGGRVLIAVGGAPYKCPPAPLEAALVMEWDFRRRGIEAEIEVFIPEPAPLAVAGPEAAARVRGLFEERGIALHTETTVTAVDPSGRGASFSDGSTREAELVVVVPVHRVPAVVDEAGLTMGKPWVPVDQATLETKAAEGVFAVGDLNAIPIGEGKGVPKAGVFASGEGRQAATLIASRILGTDPPPPYQGTGHCFLLFSGEEVAEVGGTFLAPGGPQVALGAPRPIDAKEAWEEEWRAFRI